MRDTIVPGTVEFGTFDGKPYVLNYVYTVFGIWYSQQALRRERLERRRRPGTSSRPCCETIKKAGHDAPFTYAGKHPFYIYVDAS